jgi:hypothetical protein
MKKMDKTEFVIYTAIGVIAYLVCTVFDTKKKIRTFGRRFL